MCLAGSILPRTLIILPRHAIIDSLPFCLRAFFEMATRASRDSIRQAGHEPNIIIDNNVPRQTYLVAPHETPSLLDKVGQRRVLGHTLSHLLHHKYLRVPH